MRIKPEITHLVLNRASKLKCSKYKTENSIIFWPLDFGFVQNLEFRV